MPIENERKFVLAKSFKPEALRGWAKTDIRQAYLNDGPRIREDNGACTLTYKKWIAAAQELVEIETAISREDFDLLRSECVINVDKTRYAKRLPSGDWVVDLLRDGQGAVYFVLAEVELPRGEAAPASIPEEIAPHIVHAVDALDNRFTNKKLADITRAAALYAEISGS